MTNYSPFIIYALPRSRTTWLSRFLTHGNHVCHHDLVTEGMSSKDVQRILSTPNTGTAETGMVDYWQAIRKAFPAARLAVVFRPVDDVIASLHRFGWSVDRDYLLARNEKLLEVSALPGVLSTTFEALYTREACANIFEHCLGDVMPQGWFDRFQKQNIQIDMAARMDRLNRNHTKIEALKAEASASL